MMHHKRFKPQANKFVDVLALLDMPCVNIVALSVRRRCRGLAAVLRAMTRALGGRPMLFDLWRIVEACVGNGNASRHWRCSWCITPSSPYGCYGGDGDCDRPSRTKAAAKRRSVLEPGPDVLIRRVVGREWRAVPGGDDALWPSQGVTFFVSVHRCAVCAKSRALPATLVAETEPPSQADGETVTARYDGREVTYACGLLFTCLPGGSLIVPAG